jgi:hypothetical protein
MRISPFNIQVEPSKVIADGMQISFYRRSDLKSYLEFIQYFKRIDSISEHNLIIGINFVYGWMPTIFEFTSDEIPAALELLNSAKSSNRLSDKELLLLKSLFNNSLVGTSKLLHFVNPQLYAIWDSRVYRYITGKEPYQNRIGNPMSYLTYLDWIETVVSHHEFNSLKSHLESEVGYEMSDYRCVDLVAFSFGGVKINAKVLAL